MQGENMKLNLR